MKEEEKPGTGKQAPRRSSCLLAGVCLLFFFLLKLNQLLRPLRKTDTPRAVMPFLGCVKVSKEQKRLWLLALHQVIDVHVQTHGDDQPLRPRFCGLWSSVDRFIDALD